MAEQAGVGTMVGRTPVVEGESAAGTVAAAGHVVVEREIVHLVEEVGMAEQTWFNIQI